MLVAGSDHPRNDLRRARALRENRESRRAPSGNLRDQYAGFGLAKAPRAGKRRWRAENRRDRLRRARTVYLDNASWLDHAVVPDGVAAFFELDVVGDQEAFEMGAHGRPERTLHFEQQRVGSGPHIGLGNQVSALGQEQRRDQPARFEPLDVVAAHPVQE